MATAAVLRSLDVLDNRMHLEAFSVSPASKPRRRRHTKPAGAASPPPKVAAVSSPPVVKTARVASPPPKASAAAAQGRRSPPARQAARKQGSPTKELPKQRLVMEEIRILKRGEEPPAATAPVPSPSPAPVVAQAAPVDQRVPRVPAVAQAAPTDQKAPRPTRSKQMQPAAVPTKIKFIADAPGYAGPAFSSASPEPSSLPFPAFIRRAEVEATRGLRCLLRIGELP